MDERLTRWTDERVERLKQLWHDGYSSGQIAAELRFISRNAVIGKINRLRMGRDPEHNIKTIKVGMRKSKQAPQMRRRISAVIVESTEHTERPTALPRMSQARAALARPTPEPRKTKIPTSANATLFDLGPHSCRWPIGEPGKAGFFFCAANGADVTQGRPYCGGARCRVFRDTSGGKWKQERDHGDIESNSLQWIRSATA